MAEGILMLCKASLTGGIQLTSLSVLNSLMSITAILGNTLILVALHKESASLHPPSKLLFRCLAATDLCVGLIVEPLFVVYLISVGNEHWDICRYALTSSFIIGSILVLVSLLTLAAISVERLLALVLGLSYREVVTLKRTGVILIIVWVVSIVFSTIFLWYYLITLWYARIVKVVCLLTSIVSYTKIFVTLRRYQAQVQDNVHQEQPNQTSPLNMARYRKAVSSALWVQLTLVVCYLPYAIVEALWTNKYTYPHFFLAWQCSVTVLFLNSSLNPILYCWKIPEVKQEVKKTIRQLFCSSS